MFMTEEGARLLARVGSGSELEEGMDDRVNFRASPEVGGKGNADYNRRIWEGGGYTQKAHSRSRERIA